MGMTDCFSALSALHRHWMRCSDSATNVDRSFTQFARSRHSSEAGIPIGSRWVMVDPVEGRTSPQEDTVAHRSLHDICKEVGVGVGVGDYYLQVPTSPQSLPRCGLGRAHSFPPLTLGQIAIDSPCPAGLLELLSGRGGKREMPLPVRLLLDSGASTVFSVLCGVHSAKQF